MRVLVLGGSGFLGTMLCRLLPSRGHQVAVITRDASSVARIEHSGARSLVGDFRRPSPELMRGVRDVDTVVLIAAPRLFGKRLGGLRIRGLRSEVDAIFTAGLNLAKRLDRPIVLTSGTSFRTQEDQVADESWPIARFGAARIGEGTDGLIADAVAAGQKVIQMLPAQIYGPGGMFKRMIDMARRGRNGYFGDGSNCLPRIHVEDCAQAYALVVERSVELPSGERFIMADDVACTVREFSEEVARCLKLPVPKPIPSLVARFLLGALAETVTANYRVTNAKLRAFGWQPRYPSYRESVPASIAALERGDVLP